MKENLHLKSYDIETLPPDLVEEIRRTFTIFDVDNGKLKPRSDFDVILISQCMKP